ncbi:probable glucomannan 4-beta-mannosyltransferase 6 isoform X1 [Triticum dicoccoides]|uniref:probable glucomannan 4-beta-mannosyltransferase 6 isoform X1 n=1 Tax=Triticum dicoccoides TaxID=85692 RepID=UPI00188F9EC5|nr:probable glucomannan 4-beta-mannosyltransferase 6 isoform X1 [Triticum dicoccoides]
MHHHAGGHRPAAMLAEALAGGVDRLTVSFPPGVAAFLRLLLRAWGALSVPLLRGAVMLCMAMSLMVLAEKVLLGSVSAAAKLLRRRRRPAIPPRDEEAAGGPGACFPMVLVQIPMYNEREVYQLSIGAACRLTWPADRLIVQVLDDSTDAAIKELVREECERWAGSGVDVRYEARRDRAGHKAGNLSEGMRHAYARGCEFVAIFDADFQPSPDFLARTVPLLLRDPGLALVQARWEFVNADECLLTRMQEMSMDYHFKVEQQAGSSLCNFFGYNGSAGVWRRQAIVESGGWDDRTTAEDMDLALRAALLGWEFVYVGDIKVKSELPSSLRAYRSQQHRWSCGPALLFKKMLREIVAAERVPAWKKLYIVYNFFVTRRVVSTFFTFFFFSVLLPAKTLFPQVRIPAWQMVSVPTATTLLNSAGTPWRRSAHLVVPWVAFENAMALHRFKAILIGLFEAGRANEWIVTRKSGNSRPAPGTEGRRLQRRCGLHWLELLVGALLLASGCYDCVHGHGYFYLFALPQSVMYFAIGFELLGVHHTS